MNSVVPAFSIFSRASRFRRSVSMRAERLYFDTERNPVELAISHYHPKRYSYGIELRRRI